MLRRVAPALAATLLVLVSGCISVNLGAGRPGPLEEVTVTGEGRDKVLLLDMTGVILSESVGGLLGARSRESLVDRIEAQLEKAREDDSVKALILRVNSPGGGVTASDIVYQAVRRFKQEKKVPVVATFLDVAASGGYYVAMAADEIVAHPTAITGSIGVVLNDVSLAGLFNKLGIADQTIKSGPYKDIGSPARLLSPEERAILQSQVDGLYGRFLATVRAGRPRLEPTRLRALADGRTYTAEQALEAGLVDRLGYMQDAVDAAKTRARVERARVITYIRGGEPKPTHLYAQVGAGASPSSGLELLVRALEGPGPQFLYLWTGW